MHWSKRVDQFLTSFTSPSRGLHAATNAGVQKQSCRALASRQPHRKCRQPGQDRRTGGHRNPPQGDEGRQGVQEHACWALRNLTTNADNQVKIAGMGSSRPSSGGSGLAMTWQTLGCLHDSAARAGCERSSTLLKQSARSVHTARPG